MKNLIIVLVATGFVGSAFADNTFVCGDTDQLMAHLKISDPRTENKSYDVCNGGVGDDMIDCHTKHYQVQVRDADILLKVNEDTLYGKTTLIDSENSLDGFKIFFYGDKTIHMKLKGNINNPILHLIFRTKGTTPGNPIVVGDYLLSCRNDSAKQPVYKILRDHEWKEFQSQGYFSGSKDDLKDGFIHLSPADQVERIINKYFSTDHPIYIVKFDNIDFLKRLVWEPASNGDLYPHLYNASLSIDEMANFEVRE